jgi:hypothetical protein
VIHLIRKRVPRFARQPSPVSPRQRAIARIPAILRRTMSASPLLLAACAAVATLALAGCPGEDELTCITPEPTCAPLYPPTWDNVFNTTLLPKCGTGGSGCHEGNNAQGGLRLDESDIAYAHLTSPAHDYVLLADPGCSQLLQRVYTSSSSLRMPRGSALSEAERCSLQQWVLAGAPGPVQTREAP